jgi:hypothetical protein
VAGADVLGQCVEVGVGDVEGADPGGFAVDVCLDPGDAGGVLVDVLRGGAASPHTVAEDHVDLGSLVEAQRDAAGEQVPEAQDFLAGVLQLADQGDARRPALAGDLLQGEVGALA